MRPEAPRPKPSQRTRWRYIAFRIDAWPPGRPAAGRAEFARMLQAAASESGLEEIEPWLTRFDGRHGILRVRRGEERRGREFLSGLGTLPDGTALRLVTLSTSGTIAGLGRKGLRGVRLAP